MDYNTLDLEAAKQCAHFCKRLLEDPKLDFLESDANPELRELDDEFKKDVLSFYNFMTIPINAEIKEIIIPDRYLRVFIVVTKVAVIVKMFDM